MSQLRRLAGLLLWVAVARPPQLAAQTSDAGAQVVRYASSTYLGLTNFTADFRQHIDDKMLDIPDARGTLFQEGKNHFAMRFSDPPTDRIVSDGTWLWVFLPSTSPGRVLRYPLPNHPTYASNLLGTFLDNATDRYRITYLKSETIDGHMTDAVMMEPATSGMPFRRASIWFDRENHLPRRLEIEETRDHVRVLQLSNLQTNRSIPPSTFVFEPRGLKVVSQ